MGPSEPLAQPVGRFGRSGAVEWHERGRDPGNPDHAGAPPILRDGRNLEQVWLSGDGFLKAMHGCVHVKRTAGELLIGSKVELYARACGNQAKRVTKARPQ